MTTTAPIHRNENESGYYICTVTGNWIQPIEPDPQAISIEDIAHALANSCRFTGHVSKFYSVAQHSYLVSTLVPDEDRLWAILHDASEAYLSDIARPIKNTPTFGKVYREAETRLMEAICERFSLDPEMPESVREADTMLLRAEQRDLMPNDPADGPIYENKIIPWLPKTAKRKFMEQYEEITKMPGPKPGTVKFPKKIPRGIVETRDYGDPFHYGRKNPAKAGT